MRSTPIIHAATAAAVIAFAAAPLVAQAPAGSVRNATLDAAQLPPAVAPVPGFAAAPYVTPAIDPASDFARQAPASRPHLYLSAPLSALLGLGGSVLGYGAGFVLLDCSDEGPTCARGFDNAEYVTAAAGLALGAATGAHFGGRRRDSRGSIGATLLGAAVGALPVVFVDKQGEIGTASKLSLVLAPTGAVLMDYLVRKPRN